MNILKHMEAVFVVTLALATSAAYIVETAPDAHAGVLQAASTSVATPERMAVVVVSAKRMSSVEKQQSLQEEGRLATLRSADGSRI